METEVVWDEGVVVNDPRQLLPRNGGHPDLDVRIPTSNLLLDDVVEEISLPDDERRPSVTAVLGSWRKAWPGTFPPLSPTIGERLDITPDSCACPLYR